MQQVRRRAEAEAAKGTRGAAAVVGSVGSAEKEAEGGVAGLLPDLGLASGESKGEEMVAR